MFIPLFSLYIYVHPIFYILTLHFFTFHFNIHLYFMSMDCGKGDAITGRSEIRLSFLALAKMDQKTLWMTKIKKYFCLLRRRKGTNQKVRTFLGTRSQLFATHDVHWSLRFPKEVQWQTFSTGPVENRYSTAELKASIWKERTFLKGGTFWDPRIWEKLFPYKFFTDSRGSQRK